MEKLKLHSPDLTAGNIAKIAELFPNCVTEVHDNDPRNLSSSFNLHNSSFLKHAIDFDLLRQELSADLVEGPQERYRLDWPGKREALATANAPIAKTLRPCREESVDFDTTKNLYIEGDNLEALKLLQETYLGKVKMIYIDPPYNKDADVLYPDNFAEDSTDYLARTNQDDAEGNRLVANLESNGRFHSIWLSNLFPRLKIARNLLANDGVVFISIDDVELPNLRKLCDEIFGATNHVGNIIWKNATDNNPTQIATEHEYILCFAKSKPALEPAWKGRISAAKETMLTQFGKLKAIHKDDLPALTKSFRNFVKQNSEILIPLTHYTQIDGGGPFTGSRKVHNPKPGGYVYDVDNPDTGETYAMPANGYRFPPDTMADLLKSGKVIFPDKCDQIIQIKEYLKDYQEKLSSWIVLDSRSAANSFDKLFEERKVFKNPKPHDLILWFSSFLTSTDDIVVDFYSGSATTAHAVMALNAEDSEKRRYIMVQFPELCDEKSPACKSGYATIAEIGKERIRRAGTKIRAELQAQIKGELPGSDKHQEITAKLANLDTGFRVLKVDTSNMADVFYRPDEVTQDGLALQVENIKPDRSPEDLLFQVLLDWGVDLASPIRKDEVRMMNDEVEKIYTVFTVGENDLVACFDTGVTENLIKEIAKSAPLRAVFRDASFATDATKINIEQIFKALSPHTELKAI